MKSVTPMTLDHDAFVEYLGCQMESDGYPRIAGRLFGALLLAPEDESLDDLADRLGVSKASVSLNARLLEERGLLERVGHSGDRRDFYRVSDDLFRRSMETRLARWRSFHDALAAVRPWAARRRPAVVDRIDELESAYGHMLGSIRESLDRWAVTRKPRRAAAGS
jgi:DNA-binding transcriptional regulator GbsR (MarR family)